MSDMLTEEEFLNRLEHAGVKGMKWGVRKASTSSVHVSADAARTNKIKTRVKKNGLDNLSNDDLAKLNKRTQLLSDYKKNNPGLIDRGHSATKKALAIVGTATLVGVTAGRIAKSPLAREGARVVADILKNMASSGAAGPANGGTYTQVFNAISR